MLELAIHSKLLDLMHNHSLLFPNLKTKSGYSIIINSNKSPYKKFFRHEHSLVWRSTDFESSAHYYYIETYTQIDFLIFHTLNELNIFLLDQGEEEFQQ